MITRRKKPPTRLELAPIIDIVFILLIFFAVSTSLLSNKQSIQLDLPVAETSDEHPEGVVLSIDDQQKIYIDMTEISLDSIQDYISERLETDPSLQVILSIDKSITYDLVINVLDNIKLAGCYSIALQAEKKVFR